MVSVHHSRESEHVCAHVLALLISVSLLLQACVSWASDWCRVPRCNKPPARSSWVLFGSDGRPSPSPPPCSLISRFSPGVESGSPAAEIWISNIQYFLFSTLTASYSSSLQSGSGFNSIPFIALCSRSSTWPMIWPVRWCGSLTLLVWCCCSVTGMAAYSSWFQCCRSSHLTAGCPSTRWRQVSRKIEQTPVNMYTIQYVTVK